MKFKLKVVAVVKINGMVEVDLRVVIVYLE
jgi:hypothetical protein